MTKKDQKILLGAWDNAEEIVTDIDTLSEGELIKCKEALRSRAKTIMNILDDFIDEDVFQQLTA